MKAPVGLLSGRAVLRKQDGGALPRQAPARSRRLCVRNLIVILMDTGCVALLLRDGRMISINCTGVEDALDVTMAPDANIFTSQYVKEEGLKITQANLQFLADYYQMGRKDKDLSPKELW